MKAKIGQNHALKDIVKISRYRKNLAISSSIAIFSDVSKRCNILLSQYIAIKNAHPWLDCAQKILSIIDSGGTLILSLSQNDYLRAAVLPGRLRLVCCFQIVCSS